MNCKLVNPLSDQGWNRVLAAFEAGTFFHTAEWARVLAEAYGYNPQYAVFEDDGHCIGIVPLMDVQSLWTGKRGVCLPFSDECAPLAAENVDMASMLEELRALGIRRDWRYIELRGCGNSLPGAIVTEEFAVHRLTIEPSEELQRKKLQDSHRRNVQKSSREGVIVEHLQTSSAMRTFYAMHCQTRRRHGLPPQPAQFFEILQRVVIEPGHGFVSLARLGSRWIAGAVFLQFGRQAIYKFGASDVAYQHVRANNLVMWEAINHLRKNRFSELSLGRTDLPDMGLLQFKRGWGARESRVAYQRIGVRRRVDPQKETAANRGARWSAEIIKRTPISLLRLVGTFAYRHVG